MAQPAPETNNKALLWPIPYFGITLNHTWLELFFLLILVLCLKANPRNCSRTITQMIPDQKQAPESTSIKMQGRGLL